MQPRFTSHNRDARSSTTGKPITLPEACAILQILIHGGRGAGARFMKKNGPPAPSG